MGTSSSYGGSGRGEWDRVREQFQHMSAAPAPGGDAPPEPAPPPNNDTPPPDAPPDPHDADVADLAAALAAALAKEDPDLRPREPNYYALASLFSSGGGRGGGGGAGGSRGSSRTSGRAGDRSPRLTGKGIQRGGAVLAAGVAYQQRDAAALQSFGLSLDELDALAPRARCARILAVLGDSTHPDDLALKRASMEQLKALLLNPNPPSTVEMIRDLVASYVSQLCFIELGKMHMAGQINAAEVVSKEKRLVRWVRATLRRVRLPEGRQILPNEIQGLAAKACQDGIAMLRAGGRV